MLRPFYNQLQELNTRLSFQPLLNLWNEVADQEGYISGYIKDLSNRFSQALEGSVNSITFLKENPLMVEEALATLFPIALSAQKNLYAVAPPFESTPVFASHHFRSTYLDDIGRFRFPMDEQVQQNLIEAKTHLAYKLILKSCYGVELAGGDTFICAYPGYENSIHNYFQLEWDSRFVEVVADLRLPLLPRDFLDHCHHINSLKNFGELSTLLPLRWFLFDGFVITKIREVSDEQTVFNIRNLLDLPDPFEQPARMSELRNQLSYLLSVDNADIGFTIFYDAVDEELIHQINYASLILSEVRPIEVRPLCYELKKALESPSGSYIWDCGTTTSDHIDQHLLSRGCKNALFVGFFEREELLGCLEIQSQNPILSKDRFYLKLALVQEILRFALLQYRHTVQARIDQLVRKHFTAIQPAVAWKFNNAAVTCLHRMYHGDVEILDPIVFENVYPHYGVFDIRGSSSLRQQTVLDDMIGQLKQLINITASPTSDNSQPAAQIKALADSHLNLIQSQYSDATLRNARQFVLEITPGILSYLADSHPQYRERVAEYWKTTDNNSGLFQCNQRRFEKSVTKINTYLLRRLAEEQQTLQTIYPHYIERAVTDGMEFNIYVGPSISPGRTFLKEHLIELRFWQLRFMVTIARELDVLSSELPMHMQSTQLLLAYNAVLSIRFRNDERRFDVDEVQHIHFEILKKRIDKALISQTKERLTQPGTICIVYSSEENAEEYKGYIRQLQREGMLKSNVELLELEPLEGIGVLKSFRVGLANDE